MSKEQRIKSYIVEGGSAEDTAALFQCAADLHQLSPGEVLAQSPLMIDIPELGLREACLAWIEEEELQALAVFPSLDGFLSAIQAGDLDSPPNVLLLFFEEKSEVEAALRREVKRNGWALSSDRYPRVFCTDHAGKEYEPDGEAYLKLQLCAEALSLLLTVYSHSFKKAKDNPFTLRFASKQKDGSINVSLTCPHPEAAARASRQASWQEQILQVFFRAEPRIQRENLTDLATHLIMELLEFKSVYRQEEPLDWSDDDLSDFWLSYFPYRIMASDELIQATPTILQYFFTWVSTLGRLRELRPMLRQLQTQKKLFLQRAQDPRFFGEAKAATIKLFRTDLLNPPS
jgi:hypothetical protein